MPIQGFWTLLVGMVGFFIPMIILWVALGQTAAHPFACTRCNKDVPLNSARCPACGAAVQNSDQPL